MAEMLRFPTSAPEHTIGLLHWGDLIEDFLDSIGVSFEKFASEMTGGWMFGYIDALRMRGVRTVLFCVSARVSRTAYFMHAPSGSVICVLPVSRIYRVLRRRVSNPYGWTLDECVGEVKGMRRILLAVAKEVLPYLATPLRRLRREIRRFGCERVLCQEYEYPRFDACVLLGRLMSVPVFATFQGGDWQMSRLERFIRPVSMRLCSGLIIAAGTELRRVRERYPAAHGKLAQIYNPVDVTPFLAVDRKAARAALEIPAEARVVIWHGRVDMHRKGLDVLVDAWEEICRKRPKIDLRLLLLGTGSDAADLKTRLERTGLENISWLDEYVRDRAMIGRHLAAADVHVYPSRHEGFPVAPLEAMACGVPIVAADAPGVSDILENGESSGGLVVPRGDSRALASAIIRILENEIWRCRMGTNARQRARDGFSVEAIGPQLHEFLFNRNPVAPSSMRPPLV